MITCTVLIIDDDEDDIDILSEAFTKCGVGSVHHVCTGKQAFIYLQGVSTDDLPKLIVTDHYLPGMTGRDFLQDLKQMDKYQHIHVIVLSSIKSDAEIKQYKALGATEYLVKPTSYQQYVAVAENMKSKAGL